VIVCWVKHFKDADDTNKFSTSRIIAKERQRVSADVDDVRNLKHTLSVQVPHSITQPHPTYESGGYWASTEANNNLFSPQDGESVEDDLERRIELLREVNNSRKVYKGTTTGL
jgi:hypothetical protein